MNGTTNRRLIRRVLIVSVFACLTLVAAAPMASADPCPPLDLSCTLQDTTTTAGQVLDDTTRRRPARSSTTRRPRPARSWMTRPRRPARSSTTRRPQPARSWMTRPRRSARSSTTRRRPWEASSVVRPARSVAGFPASRRGPAVNRRKVARILLPISPPRPAAARPAVAMTHRSGRRAPARRRCRAALSWDRVSSPRHRSGSASMRGSSVGRTSASSTAARARCHPVRGSRRTLAFPIMLILLVIGFVLVQNTIDRKDPKLALAPVGADHLTFS